MVETLKILGQVAPAATSNTTLYTVPIKTQAVVSSLIVCNTNAGAQTCRVYVLPAGGSASTTTAIVYDAPLAAQETRILAFGLTLPASGSIIVYASAINISFQAFGTEVSFV